MTETSTKILFQLSKTLDDEIEKACSLLHTHKSLFIRESIGVRLKAMASGESNLRAVSDEGMPKTLKAASRTW